MTDKTGSSLSPSKSTSKLGNGGGATSARGKRGEKQVIIGVTDQSKGQG